MRRRALLATSGSQGNTPSMFPMYLEWDNYGVGWQGDEWRERYADELTISLYNYLFSALETQGEVYNEFRILDSEQLTALGIEIYIQGDRVYQIQCDDISYRSHVYLYYPSQAFTCWLNEEGYMYDGQ